jgi:hypothetical protein
MLILNATGTNIISLNPHHHLQAFRFRCSWPNLVAPAKLVAINVAALCLRLQCSCLALSVVSNFKVASVIGKSANANVHSELNAKVMCQ